MEKKNINTKDEARSYAIEWQQWQSEKILSYGEMAEWNDIFKELASRFNLEEEFKENGVI